MSSPRLDELLQHPAVWRAGGGAQGETKTLPTGFRRLDDRLPGGGWPLDTLIELLVPSCGVGEIKLLVPALRELGKGDPGPRRWIVWVGPPHLPYAPALASAGIDPGRMLVVRPRGQSPSQSPMGTVPCPTLWAMEQALRSRACAVALGWVDAAEVTALRRLKLAAEEGGSLGILFRPPHRVTEPSPATLRLSLEPRDGVLDVVILKCRGGSPGRVEGVMSG